MEFLGEGEGFLAEELVGRDAAGDDEGFDGVDGGGFFELFEEDVDGGGLEGGGEVDDLLVGEEWGELVGGERDGLV